MDRIHQAKVKSGHLLLKIALVKSQRNSTMVFKLGVFIAKIVNLQTLKIKGITTNIKLHNTFQINLLSKIIANS